MVRGSTTIGKVAYSGITLTSCPTAECNPNVHETRGHPQWSAATTVGSSGRHSRLQVSNTAGQKAKDALDCGLTAQSTANITVTHKLVVICTHNNREGMTQSTECILNVQHN